MNPFVFVRDPLFSFFWKSALLAAGCVVLGKGFASYNFWIVVVSVPVLALPLSLGAIYSSVIRQTRGLRMFSRRGSLYRLMSGRVIRVGCWIAWALGSSFILLLQFHSYNLFEWACFFFVIPLYYSVFTLLRRWFGREIKEYLQVGLFLRWASVSVAVIMLLVVTFSGPYLSPPTEYTTFKEACDAAKAAVADMTGSALVREVALWTAMYDGAKAFAIGRVGSESTVAALAIMGVGSLFVFFNACTMFGCFLIPGTEYRRVFGPLSDEIEPPPVSVGRIAVISAVTTFVALFIYIPFFAQIEALTKSYGGPLVGVREKVEKIGYDVFSLGTIAKIEEAKRKLQAVAQQSTQEAGLLADRAFSEMERNVDGFLDWYYSLPAEYMRIGHMLAGDLEKYLENKLAEHLRTGAAFHAMEEGVKRAVAERGAAWAEYEAALKRIMDENRVTKENAEVMVVKQISLDDALNASAHADWVNFRTRLSAAGAGGAVGATFGTLIAKKIAGKAGLKKAAQVLVKVAGGKALGALGGGAGGAAAGAAIGSIIPGVGTVVGAVVGGVIGGIATGVAVDKLLLILEEQFSRKEFKRDLLDSIEAARREFKGATQPTI